MRIREQVREIFRMCGRAFVLSVHERLAHANRPLDTIIEQNNALGRGQTALLQSSIYIVASLKRLEAGQRQLAAEHDCLRKFAEDELVRQERLEAGQRQLAAEHDRLRKFAEDELVRQVCLETSDYGFANPEIGLMEHLYSFLPSAKALDIGAHIGDVAESLLNSGYEVFAFEPFPPVFEKLTARLGGDRRIHTFNFALGSTETEAPLHLAQDLSASGRYDDATVFSTLAPHSMPEDLPFKDAVPVPVRTLAGLHRDGTLPDDISLAKIDTEGYDLEVIRGMGDCRYPIVAAEFWDTEIPFGRSGQLYTLESMVGEMRARGYPWYLVLYRVWGRNQTAFYANHPRSVANSWGNVFFFRDYALFSEAQAWCAAALPRTYFKPVQRR